MNKPIYVHYGDDEFNENKFIEITNRIFFVKPFGGLWASRVDSNLSWKEWCINNEFCLSRLEKNFKFKLKDNARLLIITNANQLKKLPKGKLPFDNYNINVLLDFEELKKCYDAIEVIISEDQQLYWDLYGWDCDSLLVLNKNIIEVIEE